MSNVNGPEFKHLETDLVVPRVYISVSVFDIYYCEVHELLQ